MTGAPVPAAPAAPVPTPKAPSLLARLSSLWATLAALEAKYAPAPPGWFNPVGIVYHLLVGLAVTGLGLLACLLGLQFLIAWALTTAYLFGLGTGHELADGDLTTHAGHPLGGIEDMVAFLIPNVVWILLHLL